MARVASAADPERKLNAAAQKLGFRLASAYFRHLTNAVRSMVMSDPKGQQFHTGALSCFLAASTMFLIGSAYADEPAATTVYRSVSADGVVSFSDVAHASAVPVEVIAPPPARREEQERAAELFDQQLRILEILESSRRAREANDLAQQRLDLDYVRTQAALERTRALEQQNYSSSYSYPLIYPYWGYPSRPFPPYGPRPPHGGRPGMPPQVEPRPSQHVMFP
jgi:hypothetical protein